MKTPVSGHRQITAACSHVRRRVWTQFAAMFEGFIGGSVSCSKSSKMVAILGGSHARFRVQEITSMRSE